MRVDLRSDTFTQPTVAMKEYMFSAEVGDDVFGEDPSVNQLETYAAQLFGKQAAVFCPSGTMTNQIGIKINTQPQDQVICDWRSHVYNYEGGGMAFNALVSAKLLDGDRGRVTAEQISQAINPDDPHFPVSRLIVLENTVNKGGGSYYQLAQVQAIKQLAQTHSLRMHLDGARLFNALAETAEEPAQWGDCFDTISICLSKGLGAPVGSLLLGSDPDIKQARRVRKVFGGGMRQAGYLAAAGIYALQNHRPQLAQDNSRARQIGKALQDLEFVSEVHPVDTNIVIAELHEITPQQLLTALSAQDVWALPFGGQQIRMVTHLGVTDSMVDKVQQVIKGITL